MASNDDFMTGFIVGSMMSGGSGSSKKGGCYIATAVYESYDCPEVWTLRRFRDYRLKQTVLGRLFVRCYYAVSPTLVQWFGGIDWLKRFVRHPLDRLVSKLKIEGVKDMANSPLYQEQATPSRAGSQRHPAAVRLMQ